MSTILDNKETQEKIGKNILGNPICKAWLRKYPPYYDVINTYDNALDNFENILSHESIIDDKMIHTNIENIIIKFRLWVNNIRIYSPGSPEHKQYSLKFAKYSTPNEALKNSGTYCVLILGDINYSYTIINIKKMDDAKTITKCIPNSYSVNLPVPIYSKYCVLRNYDQLTLDRTGENMQGLEGYYIVGGFLKYVLNCFTKPLNSPLIQKNLYDNQLSRCEVLYSKGLTYENSYYVIASMIRPKAAHIGRGMTQTPVIDFIFSLQMNDPVMNQEVIVGRKKSLINAVPIRYIFYAFGCKTDLEMLKYICPDLNDYGLINAIRQACLEGKAHVEAVTGLIPTVDFSQGFLYFKEPLDRYMARYIVGDLILSKDYKDQAREKSGKDIDIYKNELIRQVNRLLRTKFMPGIGRLNLDQSLYEIDENELTEEQKLKISQQESIRDKAICYEMGSIVRQLYLIGNDIIPSMDKTSLLNRRIRSGQQIEIEFKKFNNVRMREIEVRVEKFFNTYVKSATAIQNQDTEDALNNEIINLAKQISSNQSQSLLNAFKGIQTKEKSKVKTDLLTPKNQSFAYSKLREIVISTDSKAAGAMVQWEHRTVHPSHLYFIDPTFCPEGGHQVGRYQMPTIFTYLTTGSIGDDVLKFIQKDKNYLPDSDTIGDKYIIKLNGSTIGYIKQYEPVETLYKNLLHARQTHEIKQDCSITIKHFDGVLDIWCDEGRIVAPFIDVKNCFEVNSSKIVMKKDFIKWLHDCEEDYQTSGDQIQVGLDKGYISLYDPEMAVYNANIAQTPEMYYKEPWKYSHIALPVQTLCCVTAINPAISMNAAVRCSYSSNHMKQAIGSVFKYPQIKYLNDAKVLLNPQLPIVRPFVYDMLGYNEKPMGQNIIIAFLMYADNQEDSFIINRTSVENGLLIIDTYTVLKSECEKQDEQFAIPDDSVIKIGNPESYLKLDPVSCLPRHVGDKFYENDALIAKVVNFKNSNGQMLKNDRSVLNEKPDACHPREANTREVRCVSKDISIDEHKTIKMVVLGQRRIGISGDKFNSVNAQKGTIGRVYSSDMMPYTASGIRPDIVFNPPSIFKRYTTGQIYEPTLGKLAALLGCPIDSTPYSTIRNNEDMDQIFEKLGIDKYGYEDMYDPESGRKMGKAFVGVMQYQRQQHLVEDKLNVRAGTGNIDRITGLPVKGRKKHGGQSMDRMSWDSFNSAGCMNLNRDLHLNQGAKTEIAICNKCHCQFTYKSKSSGKWICTSCGSHNDFLIKEVVPTQNLINSIFVGQHICFNYKEENDDENDVTKDIDNVLV